MSEVRHGHATRKGWSPEYTAWVNMLARCKPGRHDSDRYWERGVRVCDRWNPEAGGSFENFLADMGPKPGPEYSLDKDGIREGNLTYGPGLCRWATLSEQAIARRNTVWLTHEGQTLCLQAWADKLGVKRGTLLRRLKLGWPPERILTAPVDRTAGRLQGSRFVTFNGETLCVSDWSKRTGIRKDTIRYRLQSGWPIEKALTTPTATPHSEVTARV